MAIPSKLSFISCAAFLRTVLHRVGSGAGPVSLGACIVSLGFRAGERWEQRVDNYPRILGALDIGMSPYKAEHGYNHTL